MSLGARDRTETHKLIQINCFTFRLSHHQTRHFSPRNFSRREVYNTISHTPPVTKKSLFEGRLITDDCGRRRKIYRQLIKEGLSHNSVKVYSTMPKGIVGSGTTVKSPWEQREVIERLF